MAPLSLYRYPAPARSFIVRLVRSDDQVVGFVRQVGEEDDPEAFFPTEQVPAGEALRLAIARTKSTGSQLFVELGSDVEWNPEWDKLG